MAGTEHRQRILGDSGESSPSEWRWGGPGNPEPHVLLMLYAGDEGTLSALRERTAVSAALAPASS